MRQHAAHWKKQKLLLLNFEPIHKPNRQTMATPNQLTQLRERKADAWEKLREARAVLDGLLREIQLLHKCEIDLLASGRIHESEPDPFAQSASDAPGAIPPQRHLPLDGGDSNPPREPARSNSGLHPVTEF